MIINIRWFSYVSTQQTKYIFINFKGPKSEWMWIGMSDLKKEGTWVWNSNNNPATYINWHSGEPNGYTHENCGNYLVNLETLNDMGCNFQQAQQMCELILHGSS